MILLYRLLTYLLYFGFLPFAWVATKSGSIKWRDRFALDRVDEPCDFWIHAASVGEVKIASYLIRYLRQERPDLRVILTVVTEAGYRTGREEFGSGVTVRYLPIDAPIPVARTINRLKPLMIAIAETEIWPNLILAAQSRNIPVILINGRMTEKADRRYRWIRTDISQVLSCHERFFFKTQCDADRYAKYGVGPERSTVAGDMKFDAPLIERVPERTAELRRQAGVAAQDLLLVAGSTRPGEEEILCRDYVAIKSACPNFRLLLAPRHIERADEVKSLIMQMGLECRIFGESYGEPSSAAVILVNQMGILTDLYSTADLAFVGGTLVNIGGHNILEPVWAGAPVLFGPSVANVTEAAAYIEQHGYGKQVASAQELTEVILEFCAGRSTFHTKTADEYHHSPTALIGDYMLRRFPHV